MSRTQGYDQDRSGPTCPAQLLTVDELAALLRVSRTGVYRLTRAGVLQPIYLDDRPRFRLGDIERLLADRTVRG